MKELTINYLDKEYKIDQKSTPAEMIERYNIKNINPVAAILNGHLLRLSTKLRIDGTIEFVELNSSLGRRIYENGLLFLFLVAFTKKFPNLEAFIQHSIHKGVYIEIRGQNLSKREINGISDLMNEMISKKMEIKRITKVRDLFLDEMEQQGRHDIINLLRYNSSPVFKVYQLDGIEGPLDLPLVPNTEILNCFHLEKYQDGLVIMVPNFDESNEIPKFIDRPKLFNSYQEAHDWSRYLKVRTVGQLNRYIMNNTINNLVKIAEALHEKKVASIADEVTKRKHPPRLILIAGPTSSGKTTFSKRLGIQLQVNRFTPITISLDNYFVNREKTPLDADGNYDFETIEAIDVELFKHHVTELLNGNEIKLPSYNFHTGKSTPSGDKLKLEKDQVIVIEGIHGLNPKLTDGIGKKDKFKIYISALNQLNLHRHERILASDLRLIRRMVRDSHFRGYNASDTLSRWTSVRNGEKKNIFPLQEEADVVFNSALFYELAVLKPHAEMELLRVEKFDPMYVEAQRLLQFLSNILPLKPDATPNNSILKEFIGGSSFKY